MNAGELVRDAATPVAVLLAAAQLYLNGRQAKASFEDDLSREYRAITRDLPPDAFHVDADADATLLPEHRNALFRYFDLSNEQLRIASAGKRVRRDTAAAWREGIAYNMSLPRFRLAFEEQISHLPDHDKQPYFTWLGPVAEGARRQEIEASVGRQVDQPVA